MSVVVGDYSYVYDLYDIKREQVYNRSKDDIDQEKQLVNSNRFLSATFLKKRNSRFEKHVEEEIKRMNKAHKNEDDEKMYTYCQLCSIGAHVHEKTQPVPVNKRRYLKKYVDLSQWLRKLENDDSLYDLDYTVKLKTGSNKYSGTNSNIWFSIKGTKGDWPKTEIKRAKSLKEIKFPCNSELVFQIDGPFIGDLSCLKIWHDATSATDGLFLDYVQISCLEMNKTWTFVCNRWLSKHRPPDYKRVVFLYPGDGIARPEKPLINIDGSDYFVIIKTDSKMLSGTDANVTFQIKGSLALSEIFPLQTKNVNLFEKNQIDAFLLELPIDIGEPTAIKITHDSKQFASDWRIKEIKIVHSKNPNHYYLFPFEKWLDSNNQYAAVIKCQNEQQISARDPSESGNMVYYVSVFTGKARNAGTDANVFVEIGGSKGKTQSRQLENKSKNKFEKGKIDHFNFIDADVGDIRFLRIWHDNSGAAPGFFLDKVLVKCQRTVITNAKETQTESLVENLEDVKYRLKFLTSPYRQRIMKSAPIQRSRSMSRHSLMNKVKKGFKSPKRSKSLDNNNNKKSRSSSLMRSILKTPQSPRNRNRSVKFDPQAALSAKKDEEKVSKKPATVQWILTAAYDHNKFKIKKRLDMVEKSLEEIDEQELKRFKAEYKKNEGIQKAETKESSVASKKKDIDESLNNKIFVFECNQWLARDEGDKRIERILKLTEIIKQKPEYV